MKIKSPPKSNKKFYKSDIKERHKILKDVIKGFSKSPISNKLIDKELKQIRGENW